jgi:hypothetical protein
MFKTPSEEIFQEMKDTAKMVWSTYDNTYWYVDEKLAKINDLENVQDNAMVFFRMFDSVNQDKFVNNSTEEILDYISNNQ